MFVWKTSFAFIYVRMRKFYQHALKLTRPSCRTTVYLTFKNDYSFGKRKRHTTPRQAAARMLRIVTDAQSSA